MAAQTLGSTTTTYTAPRVNLLPPEIAEKARLRRAQVAMAGTGVLAVAVVGVLYTQQTAKVSSAEQAKAEAVAASTALRGDLAELQSVRDTFQEVDQAKGMLAAAMADEVLWSGYLHDMTLTIPENVWLTNYSVRMNGPRAAGTTGGEASAGPNGGGILDPGLGTITITGFAFEHRDVASWLDSQAKQKGYSNAYFTESVEVKRGNRVVVKFISTVNVTPKALSNRYTNPKGLAR